MIDIIENIESKNGLKHCYYCDKILSKSKGEIIHGCLDCCDSVAADRIDDRDKRICKLKKELQDLKEENKILIREHQVMRVSYNSLCDDINSGEHLDMNWVRSAIHDAAGDRIIGSFNTLVARLNKELQGLKSFLNGEVREVVEYCIEINKSGSANVYIDEVNELINSEQWKKLTGKE